MFIFAATWCGIYISSGITVPIQKLAEGTHEVAQGNWDYQIEAGGDDEMGVLMNSFNQMTGDLKQIKLELERRGKVVETLARQYCRGSGFGGPGGQDHDLEQGGGTDVRRRSGRLRWEKTTKKFFAPTLGRVRDIARQRQGRESVESEVQIRSAASVC